MERASGDGVEFEACNHDVVWKTMPDISIQLEPFAPAPGSERPGQLKSWARPPSVATAATTPRPRWPLVYTRPSPFEPWPVGEAIARFRLADSSPARAGGTGRLQ